MQKTLERAKHFATFKEVGNVDLGSNEIACVSTVVNKRCRHDLDSLAATRVMHYTTCQIEEWRAVSPTAMVSLTTICKKTPTY